MTLQTQLTDGIGHLLISRPESLNALTVEIAEGLGAQSTALVAQGARALVLRGEGSAFCAGADLSLVRAALDGDTHEVLTPLVHHLHTSLKKMRDLPVPIIAAIEGPAVGAGFGLALAADLRVLSETARLVPGYMGIGASPDGGVSYYLTRMLGAARAAQVLILNEAIDAPRARDLGLAQSVVGAGEAAAAAHDLADRTSATPPLALLRVRRLVDSATREDFAGQLDAEQRFVTELWDTADFREGVSAFLERRSPAFRGA